MAPLECKIFISVNTRKWLSWLVEVNQIGSLLTLWDLCNLLLSERGGSPTNWTMALRSGNLCCTKSTFLRRFSFSTTITSALHSKATLEISSWPNWWYRPTAIPPEIFQNKNFKLKLRWNFSYKIGHISNLPDA